MRRTNIFLMICCLFCLTTLAFAQEDLSEAARKERERQAAIKQKARLFTNADVATQHPADESQPPSAAANKPGSEDQPADLGGHGERYWSQKFIAAKKRIADAEQRQKDLEAQIKDYNYKLLMQSDVYDREHLYPPLIEQANQNLEKNKEEMAAAQQALDDLYVELRKSGGSPAWAESTLAEEETTPEHPTLEYFQAKLKKVDDEYEGLERPYKVQRFQLLNRRDPNEKDSLDAKDQGYAPGMDPSVPQLDQKISELEQKHQDAREGIIRQAARAGFDIQ